MKKLRREYEDLVENLIPEVELQIQELQWDLEIKDEKVLESDAEEIRDQKIVFQQLQEMNRLMLAFGIRCLKKDMMLKVSGNSI